MSQVNRFGGIALAAALAAVVPLAPAARGAVKPAPAPAPATGNSGKPGAEGMPVPDAPPLAGTKTIATGRTVDGIGCGTSEQLVYHVHAHLTIYVNGKPRQVPAGIGIPGAIATHTPTGPFVGGGKCFYWLHTHVPDGVIHIESPTRSVYTLGDLLDEWGQPLRADRVGPAKGHVTGFYNGLRWTSNPRDIPLTRHAQIQLDVGNPVTAPENITFTNGL